MGHAAAEHLMTNVMESMCDLKRQDLLQVSMDGPSVDWKFFDDFSTCMKNEGSGLVNIGSCGLHILHGAFKDAFRPVGSWMNSVIVCIGYSKTVPLDVRITPMSLDLVYSLKNFVSIVGSRINVSLKQL